MCPRISLEKVTHTQNIRLALNYILQTIDKRHLEKSYESLFHIGATSKKKGIARERGTVRLREACVFWLRELLPGRFSYPEIARAVGYSGHTSAKHAYRRYSLKIDKIIAEGASDGEGGRRYLRETIE